MFSKKITLKENKWFFLLFSLLFFRTSFDTALSSDFQSSFFIEEQQALRDLETRISRTAQVCFSPYGECELLVLKHIEAAREEILVQSYTLTSKTISEALFLKKKNGVQVRIICEKENIRGKKSKVKKLLRRGIMSRIDSIPGIAHNKVILLDKSLVITGSYNWSSGANSRNSENILFLKDKNVSRLYLKNWKECQKRSTFLRKEETI